MGECGSTGGAIAPVRTKMRGNAQQLAAMSEHLCLFGRSIGGEGVERDDHRHAEFRHVFHMTRQIGEPCAERLAVLTPEIGKGRAAVEFQRANRGDDHRDIGGEVGSPAFDVAEFFGPQIGTKAGLGDGKIGERECRLGSGNRIAAVCNVGKRSAMNERRRAGNGLHQIGTNGIDEQCRHRAGGLQIAGSDRRAGFIATDADAGQARLKIGEIGGKAKDRHDFGGDSDIKSGVAQRAIALPHANRQLPQGPVVHVEHAPPSDVARIQRQAGGSRQAIMQGIVDQRSQQVVRRSDRMEIAGKVQVDFFHGQHLRLTATGGAALAPEHRAKRRFAQCDHRLAADMVQRIA